MLFLGIISWKSASGFSGGVCFADGGLYFQVGERPIEGGIGFDGGWGVRVSKKNHKMRRVHPMPPTMGNPVYI